MKQVPKDAYRIGKYSGAARFASYFYQLETVLSLDPTSVLEVGVGDKVFGSYLKSNIDIRYVGTDVAADLLPDVIASVEKLPFDDGIFDVVCAFEVLEHLPFEKFEKALDEMARVSRKYLVISLPHFGPSLRLELKVPFLPRLRLAWKVSWPKKHFWNGQHYWEIGKRGYLPGRIRRIIGRHFHIINEFVPFENQYHHFYVLRKRDHTNRDESRA